MQAPRSKVALSFCFVLAVATTLGCAVILYFDLDPDKLGMTFRPVYHLIVRRRCVGSLPDRLRNVSNVATHAG